ncbi:DUF1659 domain-containing protein [Bacillus sp. 165]|uniref:DUF1659 domain-containing protein n=1 Tax=Bacillus sp. 165 TaxID=1529117 RepID=UPI001ADD1BFE|nr:DUF1659 domain-containing protein [Bacillus sp. 165]MBO9129985.1 DUF1659 domain-containing protein [Bacillus sp. 165]
MAVITEVQEMSLHLIYHAGTDQNGKPIMKNKVYRNVKLDAQPENMQEAALAIASLQTRTLENIQLTSTAGVNEA